MANITESHPQGWCFEPSRGLKRDWVPEIFERDKLEFAASKSESYDFATIFYEVSYCAERGFFYALGPKFLNFRNLVLPMKARYSCDGKKTYNTLDCKELSRWLSFGNSNITMDAPNLPIGEIILELELACGDIKEFKIVNRGKIRRRVVIATMQKNNDIKWIVDWLNYYRSHGVFDFRIYDNSSKNIGDVIEAIRTKVPNDVNVLVVHWPYSFGIHPIGGTLFSQRSIVLDSLYQSSSSDWFIHCDIDEYFLVDQKHSSLADFLESFEPRIGCVQFACSDAVLMTGKTYGDSITIRDINWRAKNTRPKYKNACRPSSTLSAGAHYVKLAKNNEIAAQTEPQAIYLHALPLTTGWHSSTSTRHLPKGRIDSNEFVKDRRVIDRMEKIDKIFNTAEQP